jgi:hypothetical protein
MASKPDYDIHTFNVDGHFQKMARRAGGVPRQQALETAQIALDKIKMGFGDWLNGEVELLTAATQKGRTARPDDTVWVETALTHARQIRDVGTTMGFELVTFIASNLCQVLDAILAGAGPKQEMIDCHIDALLLVKQERYRHLRPEQLPELSSGLLRVLEVSGAHRTDSGK